MGMNNDAMAFATTTQTEFPHEVRREVVDLTAADGTRLSIKLWIPDTDQPTGVVLEALPYRKDDISLIDDETRFGYYAGHGIAGARLDLRGSGSSGGILTDEYTATEHEDITDTIAWLAEQPWCNGSVGMIGISWSGFNALQVAALRPAALKAIVTACSSDDRYDNDVHYLGGVPLAFYMDLWGSVLHQMNMRPPKPSTAGPTWREEWVNRLRSNVDVTALWLSHPHRDSYWKHGSVIERPGAIECPVLLVGGWADNYTDTVMRLLDTLPDTARAIVGSWGHTWPERPEPGPGIDFLGHTLRWWRQWLNGEKTGVDTDPRLAFHVQDYAFSREDLDHRPGRWRATDDPSAIVRRTPIALGVDGRLGTPPPAGATVEYTGDLTVGTTARHPLPMGVSTDLPGLQDTDDDRSLTFDGEPLTAPVSILGRVALRLRLSSTAPTGAVFVRVTDVDPDGHSHLVARGGLNLTHRLGHGPDEVAELRPGQVEDYLIELKSTAYRFAPGHRIRVAVSTGYWPWWWPAPDLATLTIDLAASSLDLPVLLEDDPRIADIDLGHPVIAPPPAIEVGGDSEPFWTVDRDGDEVTVRRGNTGTGWLRLPDGWTVESGPDSTEYSLREGDPLSARVHRRSTQTYRWDDQSAVIDLVSTMTADRENFTIHRETRASVGDILLFQETAERVVPRGI